MAQTISPSSLLNLQSRVEALRHSLLAAEVARAEEIAAVHATHRRSAVNLVHYVELRNHDIRDLQERLAELGLSSLGRAESHVLGTIDALLTLLASLNHQTPPTLIPSIDFLQGHELLAGNAQQLLGRCPTTRSTRIMVTMPSQAADDLEFVEGLVANGMDLARINCAHDDVEVWERMIAHVRSSVTADGRRCRIIMDLAGPKLRTGPLQPGPRVVRIAPRRDRLGRVVAAACVWLTTADGSTVIGADQRFVQIPVDDAAWIARRRRGDRLMMADSRGRHRHWEILETGAGCCLASTAQTTYAMTGLTLSCQTDDEDDSVAIGELPEVAQAHRVLRGDEVILTRSLVPALPTPGGSVHYIGCSLPEVFQYAHRGEQVWLDDGKMGGTIHRVTHDEITVTITDVRPGGANLRAGKGINLPGTDLQLNALTAKDVDDLAFVSRHADVVALSFVRHPDDILQLQAELDRHDAGDIGIVLKIENVTAFANLPELLLTAMRSRDVGVMIARGDLAVEVGFDRLAEVQEEIMWACEAAHVPVIWATQVLDTLARTGQPSRAEITDAAMSGQAECVMLNKGPHIGEAIIVLDSILKRMQSHQYKKRSLLRRLRAWDHTVPV